MRVREAYFRRYGNHQVSEQVEPVCIGIDLFIPAMDTGYDLNPVAADQEGIGGILTKEMSDCLIFSRRVPVRPDS